MGVIKILFKRFVTMLFSIFLSITIVFIIPRLVPGNPIETMLQQLYVEGQALYLEQMVKEYEEAFGLRGSLLEQYFKFIVQTLKGDLGFSIFLFPTTVIELISRYLPWTIGLLLTAFILSWVIGTLIGLLAGWRESSRLMQITASFLVFIRGLPFYILALLLQFFFAYSLRLFPSSGAYSVGITASLSLNFILDVMKHSFLPALCLVLGSVTGWFLGMRAMVINIKNEDFVKFAEAKGLRKRTVVWSYVFRNALLPQVTGLSLSLASVVGGAILTETIFAYPGIGTLINLSIRRLDYPVIQGCVLVMILSVCIANFVMDIIYPLLDPRIRYGEG